MSAWTDSKIQILRENWGTMTASALAEKIGGVSRNAVIGKAHRLKLSSKIIKRPRSSSPVNSDFEETNNIRKRSRKVKFRSLLLDKNFEPAKNLQLEDLSEQTCKYMEGHPDETDSSFCGRKTVEKFSYCPLHLMIVFQPKGKKEEVVDKDDDVPKFIEKKVKSA